MNSSNNSELRICSLLPSSTEIIYELGLGDCLVGVSHECNYPEEARKKPCVTRSLIPASATSAEIDRRVSELLKKGETLYEIDIDRLKQIKPSLIITQRLCDVCAVSYNNVARAAHLLDPTPKIVSLEPGKLNDIYEDIFRIGAATRREALAAELARSLQSRVDTVLSKIKKAKWKPNVLCMEWFDPPYCAGHWIPELVALAGGVDEFGILGEDSKRIPWESILKYDPEVIVLMCCGWTVEQTLEKIRMTELCPDWSKLKAVKSKQVYVTDANYFTRSGPRVVDGLEILAKILHPDLFREDFPHRSAHRL